MLLFVINLKKNIHFKIEIGFFGKISQLELTLSVSMCRFEFNFYGVILTKVSVHDSCPTLFDFVHTLDVLHLFALFRVRKYFIVLYDLSSVAQSSNFLFLVVCSTTLWVGQLDKKTQQSDVMSLLEEFGQIESINVSLDVLCQNMIQLDHPRLDVIL